MHPTRTPDDSPIIPALDRAIRTVLGRPASLVASPGTYDHKHVARVAGVPHCVAYGPGELVLAHQPDEYCGVEELVAATKVIALASLELMTAGLGARGPGLGTCSGERLTSPLSRCPGIAFPSPGPRAPSPDRRAALLGSLQKRRPRLHSGTSGPLVTA